MKTLKKISMLFLLSFAAVSFCFAGGKKDSTSKKSTPRSFTYNKEGEIIKSAGNDSDTATITVAATSDVHGRIYPWDYAIDASDYDAGYALTYTVVKEIRNEYPNTLMIDIGDALQDNSSELFNDLDVHPMVQAMNFMKYDAWVLGNHEFNYGLDFLERNINGFEGRVIASNIQYADSGKNFVLPHQIYVVDGIRVALVGTVAPHVPMWEGSAPAHYQNLDFDNPIDAIKKTVKDIEGSYDILIAACHSGRNGEYELEGVGGVYQLAEAVPELDLILAGHEHSTYCEKVNDTWVLEPGRYGAQVAMGKFDMIKENNEWKIASIEAKNIPTKKIAAAKEIIDEFKWVDDEAKENANTVVGEITENFIPKGADYITGENKVTTMPRAQIEDTAVMDLINRVQKHYSKADISSAALFKFDQNLFKGDFKKKDVANIYKYNNTLIGVSITGENLKKYMEWTVDYYQEAKDGDVTIAFNPEFRAYNYDMFDGINYDIDISKPAGERIVNATINGKSIEPKKVYKLAVNNYRYGKIKSFGYVSDEDIYFDSYEEMPLTAPIRDLIIKYVQEELDGKLTPLCDNNWKVIGTSASFNDASVLEKIKAGEIMIPKSEDGRTPNVKAINKNNL